MKTGQKTLSLKLDTSQANKKMILIKKAITLARFTVGTIILALILNQVTGISFWVPLALVMFYKFVFYIIFRIEDNGSKYMP